MIEQLFDIKIYFYLIISRNFARNVPVFHKENNFNDFAFNRRMPTVRDV